MIQDKERIHLYKHTLGDMSEDLDTLCGRKLSEVRPYCCNVAHVPKGVEGKSDLYCVECLKGWEENG